MNVDVAGLGNAIMDALVRIPDEELLRSFELTRGQMHPVDHPRWSEIYEAARHHGVEVQPGGSCANTTATLAMLGTSCVFSGQLGDDEFGTLYAEKM